ncbi:hypothetical protein PR001_g2369 [Phytophthora rubi]|uniref:Uncharacterized protein n=1 Tax=Phytophthora rubi TaxID=129364 RepID=A0A6A3PDD7_9STRA|nr:hypothetical protein PR001_g2369 [Phytophthora rubi]
MATDGVHVDRAQSNTMNLEVLKRQDAGVMELVDTASQSSYSRVDQLGSPSLVHFSSFDVPMASLTREVAGPERVLVTTQALRSAGLRILVDDTEDANADVNARFLILGRTGCAKLSPRQRCAKRSDMPVEHLTRVRRC